MGQGYGAKCWNQCLGDQLKIINANHRQVFWDSQSKIIGCLINAHGNLIVKTEDGSRPVFPIQDESPGFTATGSITSFRTNPRFIHGNPGSSHGRTISFFAPKSGRDVFVNRCKTNPLMTETEQMTRGVKTNLFFIRNY